MPVDAEPGTDAQPVEGPLAALPLQVADASAAEPARFASAGPPRVSLPLGERSRVAMALVGAVALCAMASLWADLQQLDLVNRAIAGERFTLDEAQRVEDRVGTTAIVYTIAYILSAITFLLWYSRAYRNTIALGVQNPRYGTRWAVAYWFLPIVNLFRPKQVMNDIWRGSDPSLPPSAASWRARRVPLLLAWWWAAWLISNFVANISIRTSLRADPLRPSLDSLRTEAIAYVAADVTDVVAGILAILVIRKVTARQEERRVRAEAGTLPAAAATPTPGQAPASLPA